MVKIQIQPHKGTIDKAKNIIVSLEGLDSYVGCNIHIENKTNFSEVNIKDNENNFIFIDKDIIDFEVDLNVPDDFKGSLISLFIIIKEEDLIKDIFPVSFFIDEGESEFYGNIFIEPSFLSFSDIGHIDISSEPLSKFIFLINNSKISIFTKEDGSGSFSFKMSDIADEDVNNIERYPIYFYDNKENYTKKKFTGFYINLIPENIKTFSYSDPRCDVNSQHYVPNWRNYQIPSWCYSPPPGDCRSDEDCPTGYVCVNGRCVSINRPPISPELEIERQCLENIDYSYLNMCRINSASFSTLRNGMVFGGLSSIRKNDNIENDSFNINGYGFDFFRTSIVNKIVASGDVSICPNFNRGGESHHFDFGQTDTDYNFDVYVSENLYYQLKNINYEEIKFVLMDNLLNYVSFDIIEIKHNEDDGNYIVTLDNTNSRFIIYDWVFCVPSVIYRGDKNDISIVKQDQNLNYLMDDNGNYVKILNVSVASNPHYYDYDEIKKYDLHNDGKEYSVVNFIVEGLINNKSQLFYSKKIYDEEGSYIDMNFYLEDEFNNPTESKIYSIPEPVNRIKVGFKTYTAPDSLTIINLTTSELLLSLPITHISSNNGSDFDWYHMGVSGGDEIKIDVAKGNSSNIYVVQLHYGENDFNQMTFTGNNKNPKSSLDTNGNLHVVWESDRMGKDQVYYGTLGPEFTLNSASALSSSIDKNSKIDNISLFVKDADYITYEPENIFGSSFGWAIFTNGSDSFLDVIDNGGYFDDIRIEANPYLNGALAIASMKIVLDEDIDDPSYAENLGDIYSQINYQISFDFSLLVEQKSLLVSHDFIDRILSKEDIDIIYDNFLKTFEPTIDENIKNKKIYQKNGKKYIIGRIDGIYDKMVPIFGSYNFNQEDPSIDSDYRIKILKNEKTLKDYSFGLLLEKVYLKASEVGGNDSEEHIIFTGNSKLVVIIKTEDKEYYSDHLIVKEINDSFNIFDEHSFNLIVNYMNIEGNKYSCILSLLDEDKEIFSQSFISNIDYKYNYFDISFGVPDGKSYLSDKLLPNKMSIYDNVDLKIDYKNINISSPTYFLRDNIVSSLYVYGFRDYRLKYNFYNNEENYKTEDFYFAEDVSSGDVLSEWPESKKAFSYFMKKLYNIGMESFEGFANDTSMNGKTINFIGAGNATIQGDCYIRHSADLYGRFPTHGNKFLEANSGDFSIEFESPQASFGFFGTDIGDWGGHLSIVFNFIDGSEVEYSVPHTVGDSGGINGSVLFFGFVSESVEKQFLKVSFLNSTTNDIFGFDQMVIADISQVIELSPLSQIPITFEGVNRSPKIKTGYCNDASIVWQGNNNKYWNIYTTNSLDSLKYFRYNTMITNTESNSLMPDIALDRNGNRMIVWHDNRDNNFSIYSARSIDNYDCNFDTCKKEKLDIYKDRIVECYTEFEFECPSSGYYNFILRFFSDQNLNDMQYQIDSQESIDEFYINGFALSSVGSYDEDEFLGFEMNMGDKVIVTYIPINRENIYNKVLYAVLQGIERGL